mmetsp:Transcript_23402/g.67430  ORF Transcript_23402/g.67430 Transcript_23402/m.67430 type:complete len:239 (-) Transcript_23402:1328-2044(-)
MPSGTMRPTIRVVAGRVPSVDVVGAMTMTRMAATPRGTGRNRTTEETETRTTKASPKPRTTSATSSPRTGGCRTPISSFGRRWSSSRSRPKRSSRGSSSASAPWRRRPGSTGATVPRKCTSGADRRGGSTFRTSVRLRRPSATGTSRSLPLDIAACPRHRTRREKLLPGFRPLVSSRSDGRAMWPCPMVCRICRRKCVALPTCSMTFFVIVLYHRTSLASTEACGEPSRYGAAPEQDR